MTDGAFKQPQLGPKNGLLVDQYLEYSKALPSPEFFRAWTAIQAVGAAVERRVWTEGVHITYPNLYVFLVGPPGSGKSTALLPMSTFLRKSSAVQVAPNDISKQGLIDALKICARGAVIAGRPFDFHFMNIMISEMSNFMSKYDADLAGVLTDLFDCPPMQEEQKRGQGPTAKMIPFPGLAMILGTSTNNLGNTITHELWGTGFMARVIMVFCREKVPVVDLFHRSPLNDALAAKIVTNLAILGTLTGPMKWSADAQDALNAFENKDPPDVPPHPRLAEYAARRTLHLTKLVMIAALADLRMTITLADFNLAHHWLITAEAAMPEIFKDLAQHEDAAIYDELRRDLFIIYLRSKKPIPVALIFHKLSKRVSGFVVPRMVEVMESAGYIRRVAGTSGDDALYIPVSSEELSKEQ